MTAPAKKRAATVFPASRIKTVSSKGKPYTYHVATSIRLPERAHDSNAMRAAIAEADAHHHTKSEALPLRGFTPEEMTLSDLNQNHNADLIAFTVHGCILFVGRAQQKQILHYHSGNLAGDLAHDQNLRDRQLYLHLMAEFELVQLRQIRQRPNWTHYVAVRTDIDLKGMPRHVIFGQITPAEYIALRAVDERQGHISVARAIRDALSTSEADSYAIRDDMIERGWVEPQSPPELTTLGASLLG